MQESCISDDTNVRFKAHCATVWLELFKCFHAQTPFGRLISANFFAEDMSLDIDNQTSLSFIAPYTFTPIIFHITCLLLAENSGIGLDDEISVFPDIHEVRSARRG